MASERLGGPIRTLSCPFGIALSTPPLSALPVSIWWSSHTEPRPRRRQAGDLLSPLLFPSDDQGQCSGLSWLRKCPPSSLPFFFSRKSDKRYLSSLPVLFLFLFFFSQVRQTISSNNSYCSVYLLPPVAQLGLQLSSGQGHIGGLWCAVWIHAESSSCRRTYGVWECPVYRGRADLGQLYLWWYRWRL